MTNSTTPYSDAAAKAAHCWFKVDQVPRDAASTAWKRAARLRQALWRQARGYPVGAEPYRGGTESTPVGSRLELAFARDSVDEFPLAGRARRCARSPRHA